MPWSQTDLPKATGAVGGVTVVAEANVDVTGVAATSAVGGVTVVAEANIDVTGVAGTLSVPNRGGPTFTAEGDAQLDTSVKQFGTASLALDGTGDYVTSSASDVQTGKFTIEFWVYPNTLLGTQMIFDGGEDNDGLAIQINNGVTRVLVDNAIVIQHSNALVANEWNHVAVMQNGNFINFYTRGFSRGQYLQVSPLSATGKTLYLGARHNQSQYFDGYIDEFRTSDIARYISNFTPSTTPFEVDNNTLSLLHFDGADGSTTFDNETNVGAVSVIAEANVYPTGLEGTGAAGTVTVDAEANVPVTGLEATASSGGVTVIAEANVYPVGQEATGAVGTVTVNADAVINVTGLSATAAVGSVVVQADADVAVTGVTAPGQVNAVLVWGRIVPNQNPSYIGEEPSQAPGLSGIVPSQTPSWNATTPSQTPSYGDEAPSQTPNWDDIAA